MNGIGTGLGETVINNYSGTDQMLPAPDYAGGSVGGDDYASDTGNDFGGGGNDYASDSGNDFSSGSDFGGGGGDISC